MPEEALKSARDSMLNYNNSGMSVMEMSHRSAAFKEIFSSAKESLRKVLAVPDTHEILFLQGGATLQFAAIPMNLMHGCADYAVTGNFSRKAAEEALKYGKVNVVFESTDRIPAQNEMSLSGNADYFYYCANNTIYGTEWQYIPEAECPVVSDMSSDILSRPVDFSKHSLVYAGAQKNMAPAGLTVVILDRSLAGKESSITPSVMSYKTLIDNDSMYNTPPCWCIYMLSLTLDWVRKQGGVAAMDELRKARAGMIYDVLDDSTFYIPHAEKSSRSMMNITFRCPTEELDAEFIEGAKKEGLVNLKGHRITGGIRASLYNAMPVEGAQKLAMYMKEFEKTHV